MTPTSARNYQRQTHHAFRALRDRQRAAPCPGWKSYKFEASALLTQNVRGFPKAQGNPELWFSMFRSKLSGEQAAVTLIQETHVTRGECGDMERRHRSSWGFNKHASATSFWSETQTRAGGVAILLNPYKVSTAKVILEELTSGHFIAIQCTIGGQEIVIVNVYAPSQPAERERFYCSLASKRVSFDCPIVIGGDFNCTVLPEIDRSYSSTAQNHASQGLDDWIAAWGIHDAMAHLFPSAEASRIELEAFHAEYHTYRYSVRGVVESSRLDRWYVSNGLADWVRDVRTADLGVGSDHSAVNLVLANPSTAVRSHVRPKLYPPKACAADAVNKLSIEALLDLERVFDELHAREAAACAFTEVWDEFKRRLVRGIREATRLALQKVNCSYRTKVQRIRRRMREPGRDQQALLLLERELQSTVTVWQGLKRRSMEDKHRWGHRAGSKELFARVALPRAAQTITELESTPDAPLRASHDLASRMADGWKATFTQPPLCGVSRIFETLEAPGISAAAVTDLDALFSVAEVERSLARCKRTKSGGPDQLPNAWYRDHAALLVPVLTTLFNKCYECGVVPTSFQAATIVCIPKAGASTSPLAYRPISLLNTDYKVYMRLLSTRLKKHLDDMITRSQGGFVGGRDIHEVIDVLTGAQVQSTQFNSNTVAIMLDIKKAYDSLNRGYLQDCLYQRGFPQRFQRSITVTHSDTTARFSVNGRLSYALPLTRGIRQGCPLAPLLFIIALDPLYRWIECDPQLSEPLPLAPGLLPPVAGYADDTTLYVIDEYRLDHVEAVLSDFAVVSGLEVNKEKSLVMRLNPAAQPLQYTAGFSELRNDEMSRYLGAQVGHAATAERVWALTFQQIERRLAMAQVKTLSPRQRVNVAEAIIKPKALFVGRHCWPPLSTIKELDARVINFVWSGLFALSSHPGTRAQHWMTRPLAHLASRSGGLGVPCMELEFQVMAALQVSRWAYSPGGYTERLHKLNHRNVEVVQPDMFLSNVPVSPNCTAEMWVTGRKAMEWLYGAQLLLPDQLIIRDGIKTLRLGFNGWWWWRGAYVRDYSDFYRVGGQYILRQRQQSHGRLNVEWIQHLPLTASGSCILHADGITWTTTHLAPLGAGVTVSDFVWWRWVSPGCLSFSPTTPLPLTTEQDACFRHFCDSLVVNFPALVQRPDPLNTVRTYNVPPHADIAWSRDDDGLLHQHDHGHAAASTRVLTQRELQGIKPVLCDGVLLRPIFECGPKLTSMAMPWGSTRPWSPSRRHIKRGLSREARAAGYTELTKRHAKWAEEDSVILDALSSVPWHKFVTASGLTAYETDLWHRLRLHQLHSWGPRHTATGCPRELCVGQFDSTPLHVTWTCDYARRLWTSDASLWGARELSEGSLQRAIFTRKMPSSSYNWRAFFHDEEGTLVGDRIDHWLQVLWVQLVTCALRRLWGQRVDAAKDLRPTGIQDDWFAVRTTWLRTIQATLTSVSRSLSPGKNLDSKLLKAFFQHFAGYDVSVPDFVSSSPRYLLFFDGGSRGNPGPGGSGSVIVNLESPPRLMWVASMSYAGSTTTNNYAEYQGLCTGLKAAVRNGWSPLTVVGDSKMIIQQQQQRRRPKSRPLASLYETARSAADSIQVLGWVHHYRSYNKMADQAANQAMDTRSSYQAFGSDQRPELVAIHMWLPIDVSHWLETHVLDAG